MSSNFSARTHRTHSPVFKAQVLADCRQPGASVASVAIGHGLNPNVVRKWLCGQGIKRMGAMASAVAAPAKPKAQFVPLALGALAQVGAPDAKPEELKLQIEHGGLHVTLRCPAGTAPRYAAALSALLNAVASV